MLPELQQRQLARWFESDERTILERVVRSRIAELHSEFSESAFLNSSTFVSAGELTLEQKNKLSEAARLGVFLEVLESLETVAEARIKDGQQPFAITPQIIVN